MIFLVRGNEPAELKLNKKRLTDEYKKTKKRVWRASYIVKALMEMSNSKCCFCECKLAEESKYMQVEHFHHKFKYDSEVVEWENLLPICGRCNSQKKDFDTYKNPIINPTKINPQNHIYTRDLMIKGKDDLGSLTIEVLELNDSEGLAVPRLKVTHSVINKLDEILSFARNFSSNSTILEERKLIRKIKAILKQCGPKYPYSSIVATCILTSEEYPIIKDILLTHSLWSNEIQGLENDAYKVKLDTNK